MHIDQNLIDEIISRSDIVEILGKYLKLKRSGNNFFACCPFHNEKSASFSINPQKQFFHCFGCGESGDVIKFLVQHTNVSFVDAVKELAMLSGIHIPEDVQHTAFNKEEIKQQKQKSLTAQELLKTTIKFYQQSLMTSEAAKTYLKNSFIF